ncbi:MAG: HIT domain-containing protein [Lentisphaeria bacterium]|nr:HIT domain-containing protein [Lentisphaeria bacterium]
MPHSPPPSPYEPDSPRPLWAPWRIDYIRSPKDGACFICALAEKADSQPQEMVIARGNHCFMMMNTFPYNSGHILIAPYQHASDLAELAEPCLTEIMTLTVRAKAVMTRLFNPDGFNFGFNFGAAAGAGLEEHVHAHLVPRWFGDTNFMPVLGNTRVMPEALAATAQLLRDEWDKQS